MQNVTSARAVFFCAGGKGALIWREAPGEKILVTIQIYRFPPFFRTMGSERFPTETAGMVGWTVTDKTVKVSKISVAWNVTGSNVSFAVSLGEFVPQFDQMWVKREGGRLASGISDKMGEMVAMADSRITVAARYRNIRGRVHLES